MGPETFFRILPLNLIETDMNSLKYAQESRSYLLQVVLKYLRSGDLVFFMQYFVPQINQLDKLRLACENQRDPSFSILKAKKYETLMVQIWECLPIFCRYNSPNMSEAVSSLLGYLEPMVNKDTLRLRVLALKCFTELINHCRNTKVVTE